MKSIIRIAFLCTVGVWVTQSEAVGAPLAYAFNVASGVQFGTLDFGSGTFTNIGLTGLTAGSVNGCLGTSPNGTLYAMSTANSNPVSASLYTINPANGSAKLIGSSPNAVGTCAMTASGTMYAVVLSGANLVLYTVNLATGAPNLVGTMVASPGSLIHISLTAANNSLYFAVQPTGSTNTTLYTVNTTTGAATPVGLSEAGIGGLAYIFGTLYGFTTNVSGFSSGPAHIDVINPANGLYTAGTNVSFSNAYITSAVPAPLPYYFSDLVFGGGFQTTFTLINYSPQAVTCNTNFYADSGAPLSIPFAQGAISARTDVLPPGGSIHDQTIANLTAAVAQGWAQSSCTSPVQASLLYRYYVNGVPASEAGVNAEAAPTTEFATFAETATGVAYANPSTAQSATITFAVYNSAGTLLVSHIETLGPLQHSAANVGPLVGLSSFTGFVKITSTIPIISLSLNAEAFPVISSLPPGDLPSGTTLVAP